MIILYSITVLLLMAYIFLLVYYYMAWQLIPVFSFIRITIRLPLPTITLIIPARNEQANIGRCLQSILDQSFPSYLMEVIVVDDFSTDDTAAIVQGFAAAHPHIRLLSLAQQVTSPLNSYKKKAIELAIAQSDGKLIVTTDADCTAPPDWLFTLVAFYRLYKPVFIAAPVAINCRNRPIELFQALDFMTLQGITGAAVDQQFHSMCNGANLAYERSAFNAVGGFAGIDHIASGDDMLLMQKMCALYPYQVLFLKSTSAIVYTEPVHTVKAFLNQRIRWASKADQYNDKRIFGVLLLVYLFNVLLLVWPVLALFFPVPVPGGFWNAWWPWLILLFIKTAVELLFLYPVAVFFRKTALLWWFPLAQPLHICYTVVAGWLGKFGRYSWKGRNVR